MPTIRLFYSDPIKEGCLVTFNEKQAHYLINVMRAKPNQSIIIFNNIDGEWIAEIQEVAKKNCNALVKVKQQEPETLKPLHLYFSPIKNPTSSFIVQKATELGVTHITPIICNRTVVNKVAIEKLQAVAIEAAEQCGRLSIPMICELLPLAKVLETKAFKGPLLFCYEAEKYNSLIKINYQSNLKDSECAILVGPEGGFDKKEYELLTSKNWVIPISLGPRILKAETATIAVLAAFQIIYGSES